MQIAHRVQLSRFAYVRNVFQLQSASLRNDHQRDRTGRHGPEIAGDFIHTSRAKRGKKSLSLFRKAVDFFTLFITCRQVKAVKYYMSRKRFNTRLHMQNTVIPVYHFKQYYCPSEIAELPTLPALWRERKTWKCSDSTSSVYTNMPFREEYHQMLLYLLKFPNPNQYSSPH